MPNSSGHPAKSSSSSANSYRPVSTVATGGADELLQAWHVIWQRRLLVFFVAGLCLLAAIFYCFHATPLYRATATIEVSSQDESAIHFQDGNRQELNQLDVLNTLVLKSDRETVLKRVVEMNNLTQNLAFQVNGLKPSEGQAVVEMAGKVKSQLRRNTRLIDIAAISPDPALAQLMANGVATQFIQQEADDQMAATRFANVSLEEEASRLKNEVEHSERLLQTYREQNKTVSLEDQQNIVDQKLHALTQQLSDAQSDLAQITAQQAQARAVTNDPSMLLALPAIKMDSVVQGLQTQLAQQQTLVNFYATRYKEKYPKMIEARQRLKELLYSVNEAGIAALHTLDSLVAAAQSKVDGLVQAVSEAEKQSLSLSQLAIEYNILKRDVESNNNLYQAVLQRLKETEVSEGIKKTSIQLIEPSGLPARPFRPNRPLLIAVSLLVGLALGVGAAMAVGQFDQSVKNLEDAELKLGIPVIGLLPFDRKFDRAGGKLAILDNQHSLLSEGIRSLRANVAMIARPGGRQIVLFTSARSDEGKTMTASNYALALAQQGLRTLIIDLDLRRPRIDKNFNLKTKTPGAVDYFLGRSKLEAVIYSTDSSKLDIIPAGGMVENPSELLASPAIGRLLEEVRTKYDAIILDTAPINSVSDTLGFIAQADIVLMVVCGRHTPIKATQRAILTLQRSDVHMSGLVLNRASDRHGGYYYDYNYEKARNGKHS